MVTPILVGHPERALAFLLMAHFTFLPYYSKISALNILSGYGTILSLIVGFPLPLSLLNFKEDVFLFTGRPKKVSNFTSILSDQGYVADLHTYCV